MEDGTFPRIGVTPYPVSWRLVVSEDEQDRGFEYVRLGLILPMISEYHAHRIVVGTGRRRISCGIYQAVPMKMGRWSDTFPQHP